MIHVLYHANCYDGFGAAWAAWRKLGDEGVTYRAVNYGDECFLDLHNCDQGRLYLLDFSYPKKTLLELAKEFDITVLDHHKSAKADLEGLHFAHFDMERSGAWLAWTYFHPEPPPLMLRYIQDRDLWRFELNGSRQVSQWMRSWPFDFVTWDTLSAICEERISAVINEGESLLRFQNRQVEIMTDNAVEVTLGGHKVHAANATCFFSEVGEELCRRYPDEPFAAYWLDRADGKRQWGLRSRGGFDCTVVAKQYGGGGHPGAAGFTSDLGWHGEGS